MNKCVLKDIHLKDLKTITKKSQKNNITKLLSTALLVGCSVFPSNVYANGVADNSQISANPSILNTPTLGENSLYSIIDNISKSSTITKYVLNSSSDILNGESGIKEEKFYDLTYKDTVQNIHIHNEVDISQQIIQGKFENISSEDKGGAIFNSGKIGDITNSIFINNSSTGRYGGAIYNETNATINNINADFINNSVLGVSVRGGAIANYQNSKINDIVGDFINNKIESTTGNGIGSAIYNYGEINSVTGDFIGNQTKTYDNRAYGVVSNFGTINSITGDFINNSLESEKSSAYGIIYNSGKIGPVNSHFVKNNINSAGNVFGAIICNTGNIDQINGNYISNDVYSKSTVYGLIENEGTLGDLVGDYIDNNILAEGYVYGGLIRNFTGKSINSIKANVINNTITSNSGDIYGAFIYNQGEVGDISGTIARNDFSHSASSGIIYNSPGASIGNVTCDFLYNNIYGDTNGNMIANYGSQIKDITGNYIGNTLIYDGEKFSDSWGSFLYFRAGEGYSASVGKLKALFKDNLVDINGDIRGFVHYRAVKKSTSPVNNRDTYSEGIFSTFENNTLKSRGSIYGLVAQETGTSSEIKTIVSDFTGNKLIADKNVYGGSIYNTGNGSFIDNIAGTFINNGIEATAGGTALGGAIYNTGNIGNYDSDNKYVDGGIVNSSFIGNYAISNSGKALGGAIYSTKDLSIISTDNYHSEFTGNYTQVGTNDKVYEAIYMDSTSAKLNLLPETMGIIKFDDAISGASGYSVNMFSKDGTGEISLYNDIKNAANVTVNNVILDLANEEIHDYQFDKLISDATARYVLDVDVTKKVPVSDTITVGKNSSGVIYIDSIVLTGAVKENTRVKILNNSTNADITLDMNESAIVTTIDHVVYNNEKYYETSDLSLEKSNPSGTKDTLVIGKTTEIKNPLSTLVGIHTDYDRYFKFKTSDDYKVSSDLVDTTSGKIHISGYKDNPEQSVINANNKNLFNVQNKTIMDVSGVTITNAKSVFNIGEKSILNIDNSIFDGNNSLLKNKGVVNISSNKGDVIIKNNTRPIYNEGVINISSPSNNITINDDITGANGSIKIGSSSKGILTLNNKVTNNNIELNNGIVHFGNNAVGFENSKFDINGGAISLVNSSISNVKLGNVTLNKDLNLGLDVSFNKNKIDTVSMASFVNNGNNHIIISNLHAQDIPTAKSYTFSVLGNNVSGSVKNSLSNVFKYTGTKHISTPIYNYDVLFDSQNSLFKIGRSSSTPYNPGVMSGAVSAQLGGVLTQFESLNSGFFHMDRYTKYSGEQRLVSESINKNAYVDIAIYRRANLPETSQGMWVKPYVSYEKVGLGSGYDVTNTSYGSIFGGDTAMFRLKHGFKGVVSAFVGYNGSNQSYQGVSSMQQGGMLGATATFYRKNFFTGLTVSTGASGGEANTANGTDHFALLTAGIASKTGYNFEFKDGRVIIQPSVFVGYSFVNTFDYTSEAGVKFHSDPIHAMQVVPGIKIIGNSKLGWQPYMGVDMVFNLFGTSNVMANEVALPQLSMKPYIQYGVGIQKSWGERFTGFLQAMVRNGGRDGIVFQTGFRWAIGPDYTREKVKEREHIRIVNDMTKEVIVVPLKLPKDNWFKSMFKKDKFSKDLNKNIQQTSYKPYSQKKIIKQLSDQHKGREISKSKNSTLSFYAQY